MVVSEECYYPYGETRFSSRMIHTNKLFTGQREMARLGMYHHKGAGFRVLLLALMLNLEQ